ARVVVPSGGARRGRHGTGAPAEGPAMSTSPSPNDLTRQQLDELDSLLQRMLSLPRGGPAEDAPPVPPLPPLPEPPAGWRADAGGPPVRPPHLAADPVPALAPVAGPPITFPPEAVRPAGPGDRRPAGRPRPPPRGGRPGAAGRVPVAVRRGRGGGREGRPAHPGAGCTAGAARPVTHLRPLAVPGPGRAVAVVRGELGAGVAAGAARPGRGGGHPPGGEAPARVRRAAAVGRGRGVGRPRDGLGQLPAPLAAVAAAVRLPL